MFSFAFFILAGVGLVALIWAKSYEEKRGKTPLILKAVSIGDERVRNYHHRALHTYAEGKEVALFYLQKQLPLRARNIWYKTLSLIEEKVKEHLSNMRDTKLLKRPDGISEFFEKISDIEKGVGEINEDYPEAPHETLIVTAPEPVVAIEASVEKVIKKRSPRRKKIPVVEIE